MPPSAKKDGDPVSSVVVPNVDEALADKAPAALVIESTATTAATPGLAANMTVLGLYKRGKVPRETDLPKDYVLKHCDRDQIMVRERLNVRPLLDDDDDDNDKEKEGEGVEVPGSLLDGDDDTDGDDESDGSPSKSKKKLKKSKSKRASLFRKLSKKKKAEHKKQKQEEEAEEKERKAKEQQEEEESKYDTATFKPSEGLVMGKSDWPFYHADMDEHSDSSGDERVYDERAILWQSVENYESLMGDPAYSKYFLPPHIVEGGFDTTSDAKESHVELILDDPRFGEQVIVQGISASQIAIGDIFEVQGGRSPLRVEVSSPRLPCSYVDKKSGSPFGNKGVKRHTMTNGLAGWFTRVLTEGELRDGMSLVRTSHPHPKWTLPYISKALYGEGPKRKMMLGYPAWARSTEELAELVALEQLGRVEWKDEAKWILDGNGSDDDEEKTDDKAAAAAPIATKEVDGADEKTPDATKITDESTDESYNGGNNEDLFLWLSGGFAACCTTAALATCMPTAIFGQ